MKTVLQNAEEYVGGTQAAKILNVTYQSLNSWSNTVEKLSGYQVFERQANSSSKLYSTEDIKRFKDFQHFKKDSMLTKNQALLKAFTDPEKRGDLFPEGGVEPKVGEDVKVLFHQIINRLEESNEKTTQLLEDKDHHIALLSEDNSKLEDQVKQLIAQNQEILESNKKLRDSSQESLNKNQELIDEIKNSKAEGKKSWWGRLFS